MWTAIIVASILLVVLWIYLSFSWSVYYSGGIMGQLNRYTLDGASTFIPSFRTANGFFNIKASAIMKLVIFIVAAVADRALSGSVIPAIIFGFFTATALITQNSRRDSFRRFCAEEAKRDESSSIENSDHYKALYPAYRAYRMLFFYQIALNVLLILS